MGKRKTGANHTISLPHAWDPHPWQADAFDAIDQGCKRLLLNVHRRAGKDQFVLNAIAMQQEERIGQYWHVFPTQGMAHDHVWIGSDDQTEIRFIDQAFPNELRLGTRQTEMEIEFKNGSFYKLMGADNFNSLRGGNPLLVAFSEAAFTHPDAWSIVTPILRKNNGIAIFITTPNSTNWFYRLHEKVYNNPNWYVRDLTVEDTCKIDGTPIFSQTDIEQERIDGKPEDEIRREYYVDFKTGSPGAYYVKELQEMRAQGRIRKVDYDPKRPVVTAFDLGFSDEMVALFVQKNGSSHSIVGSRSWRDSKLEDALAECQVLFPWPLGKIILPHDAASATTRSLYIAGMAELGYGDIEILERDSVHPGIQAVRSLFPTLWIDNESREWGDNERLIGAIGGYRSKQNKHGVASATPEHSWESHWMDALRYYAVADSLGMTTSTTGPAKPLDYSQMDKVARTIR